MKIDEYKAMTTYDQYIYWLSRSVLIASYEELSIIHLLYQLDDFYIEILFYKDSPDTALFWSFTDCCFLEPFLKRISIAGIFDPY